ncbi:Hsp70 family protein, partial [Candidatus Poribacteria bacterium]|nr:Hsp70 family protein [Candidatus Poribacteria bacterium]
MEYYVGIDLGTTNSAICTFDRETQQTRVWKSPEQNDLTPSAIYINIKGDEYVGLRAYKQSPRSPDNCATLFKRFMGTDTPIELTAVNLTLTPEECSAKVLKTLFGYLPEEIRNSPYTGTVITVPTAFNLMQKKATIAAAEMAGIGNVELVQEPVAAVMSYLNSRGSTDGTYLIYDLSSGTLDIAIAESIGKRVAILAHGGIQMCGGRDFDRKIVDNIVRPWLHANFALPDNLTVNPWYKPLLRLATWATERARIELVAKDNTLISLSEVEIGTNDLKGGEIYLDIPLHRNTYDELIADHINDTIDAARETLSKTGYTPNDIECIVWIGEATHYKPLRDKVTFELGINGDTLDVNPMTALAEGASIFAESICWEDENGPRLRSKEIDFVLRRNRLFKSNSCMDLLHNPFYILKVTQLDNRQRIIEASEERSLLLDVDTCIEARSMLTIPTKRISAEVAWLPGIPPERANDILVLLESTTGSNLRSDNLPHDSLAAALSSILYTTTSTLADQVLELLNPLKEHLHDGHPIEIEYFSEIGKFLGFDKLNPLARANLLAARMLRLHDYASEVITEWIIAIAQAFDRLDPLEVCTILNTERQESGFPEINNISDVETAIREIRQYYKQVIKFVLECTYPIQE